MPIGKGNPPLSTHIPRSGMSDCVIDTTGGRVRGFEASQGLLCWRGIPYAAAPSGDRRFRAPRPPGPWTGVFDASTFGPVPPQKPAPLGMGTGRHVTYSEDCLTINVVAPRLDGKQRPVMVWIHGGAFSAGASAAPTFRGFHLAAEGDLVYVSFNYRLGVLGFTDFTCYSTADRPFDSNLGIRDQVAALEWVRDNIAEFGGDPRAVTIFGESSGGASVTTLLATPSARGLFHGAIAQSPPVHLAYLPRRHQKWATQLVGLLGARERDAAQALLTASTDALVAAGKDLTEWANQEAPGTLAFSPVVDGDFLPQHPAEAAADGHLHPVPLIIGCNDREGTIFARTGLTTLPTNETRLSRMFALTDPAAKDRIVRTYADRHAVTDIAGDHCFFWPCVQLAERHAGRAPTFMYRYDYAPPLLRLTGLDATHTTDLLPVFGEVDGLLPRALTVLGGHQALHAVSRRMRHHWISFAHHGHPATHWPSYDSDERFTLIFDRTDRIEKDPRRNRRLAWAGFVDYC